MTGAVRIDRGRGEPVVLLHGVGLRAEVWEPQIAALGRRHRVLALDLPGHGGSAPLPGRPELADYVDWAIAAIAALGLGPVSLAGHSLGALIAAGVAARPGAPVRRLALLGAVFARDPAARRAVAERAAQLAAGLADKDASITRWFSPDDDRGAVDQVRHYLQEVDIGAYAAAYRAFASVGAEYEAQYARIRVPTLVVTGALDSNSTPGMSQALGRVIPGAVVRVVEGHRHMFALTAPAEVNRLLLDWLGDARAAEDGPADALGDGWQG